MPELEDITLQCIDCPDMFVFTPGEQKFYEGKGYTPPKRCPKCRIKKRAKFAQLEGEKLRNERPPSGDEY